MKEKVFAVIVLLVATSTWMFAESTDCHNPVAVVPDGRSTYNWSHMDGNSNYYWSWVGQAGHSYSIELVFDFNNDNSSTAPSISSYNVFNVGDNICSGGSTFEGYFWTGTMSPQLPTPSFRVGALAGASGMYGLRITTGKNGGDFSFRIVDTTLFNPRWSTWSGYDTQWGFYNTSDTDIQGVLSIYTSSGTLLKTVNVIVKAGQQAFHLSIPQDLNLPRNMGGVATFAWVGPPGALMADAYMLNGNASMVVQSKFEPRNAQW